MSVHDLTALTMWYRGQRSHAPIADRRKRRKGDVSTLNIYGEQLNQVLIELTDCIGISAEERQMPINGLDRPKLGVRNEPPLSLAISRREKHIRRHRHDVIVVVGSTRATLALKAATQTIPVVFMIGSDPVATGLVTRRLSEY